MSGIDWSKAPEGATHYLPETSEFAWFPCWVKEDGSMYYIMLADGIDTSWEHDDEMDDCIPHLVKRPSPAWNGEGLPPVGVKCEAAIPHTSGPNNERSFIWIEGSVVAYHEIKGKTYSWFAEDDGFYPPNVLEFRPIRTPEQIAADEREAAVEDMLRLFGGTDSRDTYLMQRLYDAGYRKQEQPK